MAGPAASETNDLNTVSERQVVFADWWDAACMVLRRAMAIFCDVPLLTPLLQPRLSSHCPPVSLIPCMSALASYLWFPELAMLLHPVRSFPRQPRMPELFVPSQLSAA